MYALKNLFELRFDLEAYNHYLMPQYFYLYIPYRDGPVSGHTSIPELNGA